MPRGSPSATPRALVRAQVALEAFRLTPDASNVVYVLRRVRDETTSHTSGRGRLAGTAAPAHPWPRPGRRPGSLAGRTLVAFVRTPSHDDEAAAQAWVLPLEGGEPWQLTTLKHGVNSLSWSPTGDRLALVARSGDPRFIVGEERKGRSPIARRITRLDFRDDDTGHVDRRAHLWLMPCRPGAAPRQVTHGDFDVLNPAWAPDGRRIAFAADRGPDANIRPRTQIWSVGADAARPRIRELVSLAGDAYLPAFSRRWPAPRLRRHRPGGSAGGGAAGTLGRGSRRAAGREASHAT